MRVTAVLTPTRGPRRQATFDMVEWAGLYRCWTGAGDLLSISVWSGRTPLAKFEFVRRHGWRQTAVGRHRLPQPVKGSGVRPFTRLPAGGLTVPVKGMSFRRDQWPENVWRLGEVLSMAGSLTEEQWEIRRLKRGPFRDGVEAVLEWGRLPVELVREPDNPADPLAVAVWCPALADYGFLGYLPATTHGRPAAVVARGLDAGELWWGFVAAVRVHPDHPNQPGVDVTIRRQ